MNKTRRVMQVSRPAAKPQNTDPILYCCFTIVIWIVLLALYGLVFATSPLNGEDFALSRLAHARSPYGSLSWIAARSLFQIATWNARVGEQLAIFWMEMPTPWFVAANVLTFALFCWCITALARRSLAPDMSAINGWVVTNGLCWLVWPRMEIFFWRTAAAEYLQPLVLTLLLVMAFVIPDFRRVLVRNHLLMVLILICAVLAGASFENTPPAILVCLLPYLVFLWRHGGEGVKQLAAAALAYTTGWVLLMVAPSTHIRSAYYHTALHLPELSPSVALARISDSWRELFLSSPELLLVFLGCATAAGLMRKRLIITFPSPGWLLVSGVLSFQAVSLAPYTDARSFVFLWATLLVFVVSFFSSLESAGYARTCRVTVFTLGLAALAFGTGVYGEYARFADQANRRIETILETKGARPCITGLALPVLTTQATPRILANRDAWVIGNLDQVDAYFGCKVLIN